ncbi:30S ribosomal protein S3 [archaeon]|jgi:small subunit ribosomal protein S3|nr:30S ribosomal protein S3 [archaeon]MBT4373166.1 30S ribosomal protein S3 [archaeon]MBT4531511.1 30S ribosomal protein S3 [archaeon]MBT7001311.1 30S ribosomal protein S3 [archaeon]MBT7282203.1 30S ribosomal protein S3 [archaeon]
MEERKSVALKKEEFAVKEYVKTSLGKGKASKVEIEYTPVGEKIIVSTHKPGLVIGRKGERIGELTEFLKKEFKLANPHVEIKEITEPELDAQLMADEIALGLERVGPLKFKVIAYRALETIMKAGALGAELKLSGKLPSTRAKTWRFAQGYLKKAGESAKLVDRAQAVAMTKPGVVGIKVAILSPYVKLTDKVVIDEAMINKLKENMKLKDVSLKPKKKKSTRKKATKKVEEAKK